jgi:hypothetical protein
MAEDFRSAAGELLKSYQRPLPDLCIGASQYTALSTCSLTSYSDVNREILAQLQAPRLKPGLRVVFGLTVNTTCRDVVEIALRHEGYSVQSRHATPRVPQRPDAVPYAQRISLNQPVSDEHEDTTLQDTIADDTIPSPDTVVIGHAERLEWMRSLSPEQRLMIAVYGDYQERKLKAEVIAARHGLPIAEVRRYYTEACRILQQNKEHRDE